MIGTVLGGRYEVRRELGRGGMGVVYAARDPILSRDVAVKLIPPVMLTPETEERFLREAQTVAAMDHPGIVPIHDLGRDVDGSIYFVMPVLAGRTLRHLLDQGGLSLGDALSIAAQVADALAYGHDRGIVHRDVKPENVMVETEGGAPRVRVMDYGLCRNVSDTRITRTGMVVGTLSYSSPEQVAGEDVDPRTDIFSLGGMLYECLAGEPPFSGHAAAVLLKITREEPPPLPPDVDPELSGIVFGCLAKAREARPQRVADVADALRRYRGGHSAAETSRAFSGVPRQAEARAGGPFVGRERELAELSRRLDAALAGECQLVLVGGEAGIGKSRLLAELRSLARARGFRVLRGVFAEQDRAFAYQGFCELVQDFFRGRGAGASSSALDLSDLAPDLLALFPVLSEVPELRSALTDSRGSVIVERGSESRLTPLELLARTLGRLGGGRPLVLLLENLHAADVSLEVLPYIVRRLALTPTLVVGAYRQTEVDRRHPLSRLHESFADDPRFCSLVLGPLSASVHGVLVKSLLSGEDVQPSVAERLHQASEGNPFFTQELVRSLVDSGALAKGVSGEFAFGDAGGIPAEALPATIQQAVEKRVGRLPADLKEILSTASVLGRDFALSDLEELIGSALDEPVDRLVREGYLEEDTRAREDRLIFASGVVRDVLHGSLSRRRRRSLHLAAARLLEARHAGRLERVYPQLLHHFSQGDAAEKAVEYGFRLARWHLSAFNAGEALRALKETRAFLDDLPDGRERAAEAYLCASRAHRMAGDLDAALREAEAALARLEVGAVATRGEVLLLAAEIAWQARRVEEARGFVERGLEVAREAPESISREALARLLGLGATVANLRGERGKAEEWLAEADRLTRAETGAPDETPRDGTLVVALANEVLAREPTSVKTDDECEVLANVFETLVVADERGNLVPKLCTSHEVAENGRLVSFRLRPEARFSDGVPLTAEVAVAFFERALACPSGSVIGAALDGPVSAAGPYTLEFHLREPLPLFPSFFTDPRSAIAKPGSDGTALGTGPFRMSRSGPEGSILLERNPHHAGQAACLAAIDFRTAIPSAAIASGFRSGLYDLVRDLAPRDLDELLRDARIRSRLVEAPKKGTYFVQFDTRRGLLSRPEARRALAGVVRTLDLVRGTLGRFVSPATGLIPPGILGHDPGRRATELSIPKARELLLSAGIAGPLDVRAAVHPILLDRYRALTDALLSTWRGLGISVEIVTGSLAEYLDTWEGTREVDLLIGRWYADYDDPDSFTYGLFHGANGELRGRFSSPDSDELLTAARLEPCPGAREALYREYESRLLRDAVVLPLFHEADLRLTGPRVSGTALSGSPPFVNYSRLGKRDAAPVEGASRAAGGTLRIPIAGVVTELDPALTWTMEQAEVLSSVFETLTRDVGGRVVPHLAEEVLVENEGRAYRLRLRPDVWFHDGRRLTARDVRHSFERLVATERNDHRWLLSSIRGAQAVIEGGRERLLEGVQIVSPLELVIHLTEPVSFFPALLCYPATAILPEGTAAIGRGVRDGAVGTGPFLVTRFDPGRRLELERHPGYWRDGLPKSDSLVFRFGLSPEEIRQDFAEGRLSIASDLYPANAESFRANPTFAAGYRESPRLSTYFVVLSRSWGPLADGAVRRRLYASLQRSRHSVVTRALGRRAVPASGLIPPGLLGSVPQDPAGHTSIEETTFPSFPQQLTAAVHPVFLGQYEAFFQEMVRLFLAAGYFVKPLNRTMAEFSEFRRTAECDVVFARWIADFPDPDTFVRGTLHHEASWGRYIGDPALDDLGKRSRSEMNPVERSDLLRQVEEVLAKDALVLPLFHEQTYRIARPEVEGLTVSLGRPVVAYEELSLRHP